jgi:pimeloyl-ACP methyl ester carboxylesterase
MQKALPEVRLELVPDAGHTVHLEQPVAWASAIESFV